jgi:non-heme chloroperoxidase
MPYFNLNPTTHLYYEDQGQGQPVLFIHGLWGNSRFSFRKQLPYFSQRYRTIALDLRGHGRSSHVHSGHTVATYARDVRALIDGLGITDVVLVGHSMGAFVVWDYIKQFGTKGVKATVIIDQSASDFKWLDWPIGAFDFSTLCQLMATVQTDRASVVQDLLTLVFKNQPTEEDARFLTEDALRMPESIAGMILFDESVQDYRPVLSSVTVPTLLCFGRDEKLVPIAAGEHLQQSLPNARLVIFENSGHCPTLEEPDRFNQEVDQFIQSLG